MTIAAGSVRTLYTTDGVSTAFAVPFPFFGAAELNAALVTGGVANFLRLNADYTIDGGNGATGTLAFIEPPSAGQTLLIYRLTNRSQLLDLQANDNLPVSSLENALDRIVALSAEDADTMTRTLRGPVQDLAMPALPSAPIRRNTVMTFDANGNPTVTPMAMFMGPVGTANPLDILHLTQLGWGGAGVTDTNLTRTAAGTLALGNGSAGDATGALLAGSITTATVMAPGAAALNLASDLASTTNVIRLGGSTVSRSNGANLIDLQQQVNTSGSTQPGQPCLSVGSFITGDGTSAVNVYNHNAYLVCSALHNAAGGATSQHVAILAAVTRNPPPSGYPAGRSGAELWSLWLPYLDASGQPSSIGGSFSTAEIDLSANGLDDVNSPIGNRFVFDIGLDANSAFPVAGTAFCEWGSAFYVNASNSPTKQSWFQSPIKIYSPYTIAAIDISQGTQARSNPLVPGSVNVGVGIKMRAGLKLALDGDGQSGSFVVRNATKKRVEIWGGGTAGATQLGPPAIASQVTAIFPDQPGQFAGFRNRVINGDMSVWQRGTTIAAVDQAYGPDQWLTFRNGSGAVASMIRSGTTEQVMLDANMRWWCLIQTTAAGTSETYSQFGQKIEDVLTFSGQDVTLSFWAKADTTRSVSAFLRQSFGTGGSSNADTLFLAATTINLTTTPQRFSITTTLPSTYGKTIGSAGDDYLGVFFNIPLNTTSSIYITGVQLEPDSLATAFELRSRAVELNLCQRYYAPFMASSRFPASAGGQVIDDNVSFPISMRVTPTISTLAAPSNGNASSVVLTPQDNNSARLVLTSTAAGDCYTLGGAYAASAIIP